MFPPPAPAPTPSAAAIPGISVSHTCTHTHTSGRDVAQHPEDVGEVKVSIISDLFCVFGLSVTTTAATANPTRTPDRTPGRKRSQLNPDIISEKYKNRLNPSFSYSYEYSSVTSPTDYTSSSYRRYWVIFNILICNFNI